MRVSPELERLLNRGWGYLSMKSEEAHTGAVERSAWDGNQDWSCINFFLE